MKNRIQRSVGLYVGTGAVLLALIQYAATLIEFNLPPLQTFLVPSVIFVLLTGIIIIITGFINNKSFKALQVCIAFLTGYGSCLSAGSGDLTYLVFFLLGFYLSMEYGFLDNYFILKASVILGLLLLTLTYGLVIISRLSVWVIIHSLLGAVIIMAIFRLLFKVSLKRYTERTKKLEDIINDRTRNLQDEIQRGHELTDNLQAALEDKNQLLKVKETLVKEIHHRTKNNMQLISSLLNLEKLNCEGSCIGQAFENSISRIKTLALSHELLYKQDNMTALSLKSYIEELSTDFCKSFLGGRIELTINIPSDINIDLDFATPLGLILNEILTNAIKHAFPEKDNPRIDILVSLSEGRLILNFRDNGIGLPDSIDYLKPETLGLQLVSALVKQTDGKHSLKREGGTEWIFDFPFPKTR